MCCHQRILQKALFHTASLHTRRYYNNGILCVLTTDQLNQNQQQTTNNQQPTTNYQQPTTVPKANNQQQTTKNQQQTTNRQQPTTNSQQPTANNQQPTTNNRQPTANNHQPTTNNQQPTTINQHSTRFHSLAAGGGGDKRSQGIKSNKKRSTYVTSKDVILSLSRNYINKLYFSLKKIIS